MDKFELQKLRELPIEGVAERLGLRVVRHKCLCPFHDDHHASLSFSVKKNSWRCFVCGARGGTIDLVMRYLNKDFKEACRWLADEYCVIISDEGWRAEGRRAEGRSEGLRSEGWRSEGWRSEGQGHDRPCRTSQATCPSDQAFDATRYERFFERPWLSEAARRFLFDERRLDKRVVRWCRLTSWRDRKGTDWLQVPYYSCDGRLTGVQNRNLMPGASPRFRFPTGSHCSIYNLPVLNRLRPGEALYITEGCSDCWAMLSAGHKAIAIPSATLLMPRDVELLTALSASQSTQFHMYPDRDEPGERLFLQLKEVLPGLEHHQLPAGCKDFSEYYLAERRKEPDG